MPTLLRNQNGFQGQNILSKLLFENWNEFKPALLPHPLRTQLLLPAVIYHGADCAFVPALPQTKCPCKDYNHHQTSPPGENIKQLARTWGLAREGWFSPGNSFLQTICARADARRIPVKIGRSRSEEGENCICGVLILQQGGFKPFSKVFGFHFFSLHSSLCFSSHFQEGISKMYNIVRDVLVKNFSFICCSS